MLSGGSNDSNRLSFLIFLMPALWADSCTNSVIGNNPGGYRNTVGNGHAVPTVQEEIAKETKKKDVMEVLDSIAVEETTTLDLWIGYSACSVKISG